MARWLRMTWFFKTMHSRAVLKASAGMRNTRPAESLYETKYTGSKNHERCSKLYYTSFWL